MTLITGHEIGLVSYPAACPFSSAPHLFFHLAHHQPPPPAEPRNYISHLDRVANQRPLFHCSTVCSCAKEKYGRSSRWQSEGGN